jgi:ABC-type amino acid transport substrate-binding protein
MKLGNALAAVTSCLVVCAVLASCQKGASQNGNGGDLAKIVEAKKIVIGTEAGYKPFEYLNIKTNQVQGFDVSFVKLVTDALDEKYGTTLTVEWKDMDFDGLIGSLQANQIDLIAAAFSITEERAKSVLFSDPYFQAKTVVVVKDTDTSITSMDVLKTKICGAQLGTVQGDLITSDGWNKDNKALKNVADITLALQAGTIDALVVEKPVAQSILASVTGLKMIDSLGFEDDGGYGVASNLKTGSDLISSVNEVIKTNTENGKLDQLYIEAADEAAQN